MNWLRQKTDEPLFPDILWSRPENRRHAGKLLVIGGHAQNFSAVSGAYGAALKSGAGAVRVIVPQKLQPTLKNIFPETEYASSNEIGSFSRQALAELLDAADWADAVLLAGDFGKNSETAILLESFIEKYQSKLTLSGDSIDYFLTQPDKLVKRPETLVVGSLNQIQKIAAPNLIRQNSDLLKVLEQLSEWVLKTDLAAVTVHSNKAIVAFGQQISTTPVNISVPDINLAAYASVWWLQQPKQAFEALTTSVYCLSA